MFLARLMASKMATCSAAQVLGLAAARGIALSAADGKLHYRAPAGALTSDLRAVLVQYKPALLVYFSIPPALLERFKKAWNGLHIGVMDLADYLAEDLQEASTLPDTLLRLIASDLSHR